MILRSFLAASGALLSLQAFCIPAIAQWVGSSPASGSDSLLRIQTPGSPGSGVLVNAPYKDATITLLILTAYHVVADVGPNEEIILETSPGKSITIRGSSITSKWPEKDIAIIDTRTLTSPQRSILSSIRPATLGVEMLSNLNSPIVVAGFPIPGLDLETMDLRVSEGKIQTYGRGAIGKGLIGYSAKTFPGMSGGGAFNEQGLLIGIHVRGEKDALSSRNQNSNDYPAKTGTNYARSSSDILSLLRSTFVNNRDLVSQFERGSQLIISGDYKSAHQIFKDLSAQYPESLVIDVNYKCLSQRLKPQHHEGASGLNLKMESVERDPRIVESILKNDPLRKAGVRIGDADLLDFGADFISTIFIRPFGIGGYLSKKNPLLHYKQCNSYIAIRDTGGRRSKKYVTLSKVGWDF